VAAIDYIHEKVWVAIGCLCEGSQPFEARMFGAYVSALGRLGSSDPTAEIAEDLNSALLMCLDHIPEDGGRMIPWSEMDQSRVCEKLLRVLVATSRMTAQDAPGKDDTDEEPYNPTDEDLGSLPPEEPPV
jgi:hypothetical protein